MKANLFNIPGIEVGEATDSELGQPVLIFRNLRESFFTGLVWNGYMLGDITFWNTIADKINTLIFNRVKFEDRIYSTEEELLSFIERHFPKYTPKEKLNLVLEYIAGLTKYDGEEIDINIQKDINDTQLWRKFYFVNEAEFIYYLENLKSQNLISYDSVAGGFTHLKITLNGLTALVKINEKMNSRFCFVAMSFDSVLDVVYDEAIEPAIKKTGFLPIIIRNEHVESEKTINDAIIAGIKKSRFTIADFTQHKNGVYFEAGYALGRGQKVIYTCREDELKKAHFDLRNNQHVVWKDIEDYKRKLVDKIEAFIKD